MLERVWLEKVVFLGTDEPVPIDPVPDKIAVPESVMVLLGITEAKTEVSVEVTVVCPTTMVVRIEEVAVAVDETVLVVMEAVDPPERGNMPL